MFYRIMQFASFIVGALFALAALKGITEPWRQMNSVMATQVAAGYLIAAILSIISIVAAWQFGIKARELKDSN
jgi:divalent metal cation (Fe/Co/Zn/Cd) transporter